LTNRKVSENPARHIYLNPVIYGKRKNSKGSTIVGLPLLFCVKHHQMSTEQQQPGTSNDVIADQLNDLRQAELEGYELAVKKARNALFWTAGLILFWELVTMYRTLAEFDPGITAFAVIVAAIFAGLALWTKKKPYTALIAGIIAFVAYILLAVVANGYVDGTTGAFKALVSGIFIKVIIFVQLIRPLKEAKELQAARAQRF
jgi:hypothetical protein